MKIRIIYKSIDDFKEIKNFTSLKKAQEYAKEWIGNFPEIGSDYAISEDGIGKIYCEGCTLKVLFRNTKIDIVDGIKKVVNQKPSKGERKMTNDKLTYEMIENFVIGASDARFSTGSLKKAKPAVEAVEGVEAVEAVEAVKAVKAIKANKTKGIEAAPAIKAVKAVAGVKGVKAVEAQPATEAVQTVYYRAKTEEIAQQVWARMKDQGYEDAFGGQIIEEKGLFNLTYKAPTIAELRAAFKKCKAKDGYNAPGLKALAEKAKADKAAKKAEEKAKKDAEKAAEKAKEKVEPAEDDTPQANGDETDWPEEFDEE